MTKKVVAVVEFQCGVCGHIQAVEIQPDENRIMAYACSNCNQVHRVTYFPKGVMDFLEEANR